MVNNYYKLLILLAVIIFLIGVIMLAIAFYGTKETKEYNGICVFDLDGTLTVDLDNAAKAISKCRELNFKIAFNTARPTKWYSDLNLDKLGLTVEDLEEDFYHGEEYKCSFVDRKCAEDTIAGTKVKHLYTLSNKWNVVPKKVVLFDDQYSNIKHAENSGFSTVYANKNDHLGGIPDNVEEKIEKVSMN